MHYLLNHLCSHRLDNQFFYTLKIIIIMKKNVGNLDRIIRLVVAFVIVGLLLTKTVAFSSVLGIVLTIVAVVFIGTALASSCPLYSLVGLSTCPVEAKN